MEVIFIYKSKQGNNNKPPKYITVNKAIVICHTNI